jgi:hypothetical protein
MVANHNEIEQCVSPHAVRIQDNKQRAASSAQHTNKHYQATRSKQRATSN